MRGRVSSSTWYRFSCRRSRQTASGRRTARCRRSATARPTSASARSSARRRRPRRAGRPVRERAARHCPRARGSRSAAPTHPDADPVRPACRRCRQLARAAPEGSRRRARPARAARASRVSRKHAARSAGGVRRRGIGTIAQSASASSSDQLHSTGAEKLPSPSGSTEIRTSVKDNASSKAWLLPAPMERKVPLPGKSSAVCATNGVTVSASTEMLLLLSETRPVNL